MPSVVELMEEKDLHVHMINKCPYETNIIEYLEWCQGVYDNFNTYTESSLVLSKSHTHYIIQGADVVFIGNQVLIDNFVKNFQEKK